MSKSTDTSNFAPGTVTELVCSIFSGFDTLGLGFEKNGFCVVGGIDIIFDRDVRNFHPPNNKFNGLIGGSPCQDFSKLRRVPQTGYGIEMINEFKRIVLESNTEWFLLENVPTVPNIEVNGYYVQRFSLCPTELGFNQSRRRHFQFGSRDGRILRFNRTKYLGKIEPCLTAKNDARPFEKMCKLQGLEHVPTLTEFTLNARKKLIGNSVHLEVSKEIARSIRDATERINERPITGLKFCLCGCGELIENNATMKNASCRKRMERLRKVNQNLLPEQSH